MKVLLLAHSNPARSEPLGSILPGPMIPLVNRPVMSYLLELCSRQGFRQVVVCLHTMAAAVESYFQTGRRWGLQIEYVLQRDWPGSAGSIRRAARTLNETFLVLPGDVLLTCDCTGMLQFHSQHANLATVGLGPDGEPNGVYLFEPGIIQAIPHRAVMEIPELLEKLQSDGLQPAEYRLEGYWNPLMTLEDYWNATRALLKISSSNLPRNEAALHLMPFQMSGYQASEGIWVGRHTFIHASAQINPPVVIGERCWVGQQAVLGPELVVGSNVIIDREVVMQRSIVLENSYVGQRVTLDSRIVRQNLLVDICTGASTRLTDSFLLWRVTPSLSELVLKRVFDITLAAVLLVLCLPVGLVLALLAWLSCGRVFEPLTIAARAAGAGEIQDGQPVGGFRVYRFATGRKTGEPGWFGRFLHRTGLYRLPDLINVIAGQMRMVGVKPISIIEMDQLTEEWQKVRCSAPAGFTGLWYIQALEPGDLDAVSAADAYYTVMQNWRFDVAILWATPKAWLKRVILR